MSAAKVVDILDQSSSTSQEAEYEPIGTQEWVHRLWMVSEGLGISRHTIENFVSHWDEWRRPHG